MVDYGVPFDSTLSPYKTRSRTNRYYLSPKARIRCIPPHPARATWSPGQRQGARPESSSTSRYPKLHYQGSVKFHPGTTVTSLIQGADGRVTASGKTDYGLCPTYVRRTYARR